MILNLSLLEFHNNDDEENKFMEKIKYLHVMTHPSMFINGGIIDMINNDPLSFNPREHLFLVGYNDIYEKYKNFGNVKFIPKIMTKNYRSFIHYSKNADYVFLHQNYFYDFIRFIFTPIKIRKKYIWCVWGHDLYTNLGKLEGAREKIKLIARRIGDLLINYEVKYYRGIGIGFKYDALEIKKRFKDKVSIFMCPYVSGVTTEQMDSIKEETQSMKKGEKAPVRIMVGHSAHQYLHHKEMLDKLSAYKNENILVSLVLVYGSQVYAKKVVEYAKKIFGEKVEILRSRMDFKGYLRYLSTVDIAVFDQIHQCGLGNLHYLSYMEKKIYLNKDGFLKQAFLLEGIYFNTTNKLGLEPFEEFVKGNFCKERGKQYATFLSDNQNRVDMWKSTLKSLE